MSKIPTKVAIVGGGIAGPILALSLRQTGISSTVYESKELTATQSGAISLTPNSLRVLDSLGLYERVSAISAEFETVSYVNSRFALLANFRLGGTDIYGFPALSMPKGALRDVLLEACKESDGIEVRHGLQCFGIRGLDGSRDREVHFRHTAGLSEQHSNKGATENHGILAGEANKNDTVTVAADLVIGADGFDSIVRRITFPRTPLPEYTGLVSLTGKLPYSAVPSGSGKKAAIPTACSAFSRRNFLGFKPLPRNVENEDQMLSFVANFGHEDLGPDAWCRLQGGGGAAELLQLLKKEYSQDDGLWPKWLQQALASQKGEDIRCWPHYLLPALPTYLSADKRVILIGDAAHGMPPTTGQGANAAIEDAYTLALAISKARDGTEALDSSLTHWDSHRRMRIKKMVDHDMQGSSLIQKRNGARTQKVKEIGMKAIYKTVLGEKGGLRWVFEYDSRKALDESQKVAAK